MATTIMVIADMASLAEIRKLQSANVTKNIARENPREENSMRVDGILIDTGYVEEICREHGVTDEKEIKDILSLMDSDQSFFIETVIENYKDKQARDADSG